VERLQSWLTTLCWTIPLLCVLLTALWLYFKWYHQKCDESVHRWAQDQGLKLLVLEPRRHGVWSRPREIRVGKHDRVYHFVAQDRSGESISGCISVGTSPMSLLPDRIRVMTEE
jgi:hypothetical protein